MNSPEPNQNWDRLTEQARLATAPVDLDMRQAIRAQISAQSVRPRIAAQPGLFDELLALGSARWLQAGLTCLMVGAAWSCWQGVAIVHELTLLWSFEGLLLARL
jgi:hypothetical protein